MAMQNIERTDSSPSALMRKAQASRQGRVKSAADGPSEPGRALADGTTDSVVLSPEARRQERLQGDLAAARQALASVPDVRRDRIAEARQRLAEGVYATETVRGTVATRLGAVMRKLEDLIG